MTACSIVILTGAGEINLESSGGGGFERSGTGPATIVVPELVRVLVGG